MVGERAECKVHVDVECRCKFGKIGRLEIQIPRVGLINAGCFYTQPTKAPTTASQPHSATPDCYYVHVLYMYTLACLPYLTLPLPRLYRLSVCLHPCAYAALPLLHSSFQRPGHARLESAAHHG
jgi:hypothetical protein